VDWKRQAPDYVAVMESEQAGSGLMIFLIMIIAAVGISNTMLMSVLERGREVGMMRALGMTDRQVRRLFLWESAVIGGVGSAMGLAFGALITFFFVRWGLDFSSVMKESNFGYRSAGHFYGAWHAPGFFYAVLLGVGLSVVVAWISTRRLLRLSIPAVLRYE
jgi:ABC-type lipoprotein release transport system permease subunit